MNSHLGKMRFFYTAENQEQLEGGLVHWLTADTNSLMTYALGNVSTNLSKLN